MNSEIQSKIRVGEKVKDLYIIGAGGVGRDLVALIERVNALNNEWNFKGFLDDNKNLHGEMIDGYLVLGGIDYLIKSDEESWVICAIANYIVKLTMVKKIVKFKNIRFATLVDPSVIIFKNAKIGVGSIIYAGAILAIDAQIGNHAIVHLNSTVGHDSVLNDYGIIYPGVNVSGCVTIGKGTEIGTGSKVIQGITIGENTVVGAGAIVTKDIPDNCTAVGCPCKPIKFHDIPGEILPNDKL